MVLVRRARLGKTVKAVSFAIAHYADANGRRIFPGVARLAWECEMNYNTVQSALRRLRDAGLIERTRRAVRRGARSARQRADEYRLIIGPDLFEKVEVPSPAEADLAIDRLAKSKEGKDSTGDLHPSGQGADDDDEDLFEPVDNSDLHPVRMGAEAATVEFSAPIRTVLSNGSAPRADGCTDRSAPRADGCHQELQAVTRATTHTVTGVVDNLALSRAEPAEDPIPAVDVVRDRRADTYGRHAAPLDPTDNVIRVDFGAA